MPEAQQAEPQPGGGTSNWIRTGVQTVGIFIAVNLITRQFAAAPKPVATTTLPNGTIIRTPSVPQQVPAFEYRAAPNDLQNEYSIIPQRIAPVWTPEDNPVDLQILVSPSFHPPSLTSPSPAIPVLDEKDFRYGQWNDSRDIHTSFAVPKEVQNNGTLWAHFFIGLTGSPLDPRDRAYDPSKAYHFSRPMNQYLKKRKVVKGRNLLAKSEDPVEEEPEAESGPIMASHYHPNITFSFIPDSGIMAWTQMHPGIREFVSLESTGSRDESGYNGWYYPILFANDFFNLRKDFQLINETVETLPLNIHLNTLSNWKFNIVATMNYGFKDQAAKAARGEVMPGGGDGSEIEQIKVIILDSNIYLLGTTIVVGILHTIFEMLAFKSDVSHWRNKKDNVGISVRTILANVFMQAVIFLYLLDNNENTSWMILLTQGMGILVEAWKITKTVDVRLRPTNAETTGLWAYLPYELKFEDKHKLSDTEKQTQEYDQIAFRYMYIGGVPLILAYAAYSLYYESHKSWYSFVITTLVGSVYAYGFLLLLPSLYINYRLKSVAHMPGKAMTYKVLSTFIDDLFAFTVKMPTMHRLATLRDDVVFFVYLYQRWAYKVDHTRVNEFGQGGEEDEKEGAVAKKEVVEVAKAEAHARTEVVKEAEKGKASGSEIKGSAKKRRA